MWPDDELSPRAAAVVANAPPLSADEIARIRALLWSRPAATDPTSARPPNDHDDGRGGGEDAA